jgi:cytoskeletal protein CcmA (bactofilin family)
VTEELDVAEYVAVRLFATANRMRITKKGKVFADVRADDLTIEGFLHGHATALSTIRLSKSAHVTGGVRAPTLVVEPGATLVGDVRVGLESMADILESARASEG